MAHDDNIEHELESDVALAEPEVKKPPMYAVVLYNDDYTPMDFVVEVLQTEFKLGVDDAVNVMLSVHHEGKGVAGIFTKDIAETKAKKVNNLAKQAGYPLLSDIEPHHA